jgi:acetyl-CoA C-acetyltransferase
MGLAETGQGPRVGATGVSMHAMQLASEAGDMQIPTAQIAGVFSMVGVAMANYLSILERRV